MKMKEYFQNLPVGEVVNKRGLAYLKRLGFIWDYSRFGYLETLTVTLRRDVDDSYTKREMRYAFPKGNAKECERFEGAMYEKWRQGHASADLTQDEFFDKFGVRDSFVLNGIQFRTQYFDGCFSAYLVKDGPANGKQVNHRLAFPGGVC